MDYKFSYGARCKYPENPEVFKAPIGDDWGLFLDCWGPLGPVVGSGLEGSPVERATPVYLRHSSGVQLFL